MLWEEKGFPLPWTMSDSGAMLCPPCFSVGDAPLQRNNRKLSGLGLQAGARVEALWGSQSSFAPMPGNTSASADLVIVGSSHYSFLLLLESAILRFKLKLIAGKYRNKRHCECFHR